MGAVMAYARGAIATSESGTFDITTSYLGGLTPKAVYVYATTFATTNTTLGIQTSQDSSLSGGFYDGTTSRCWNLSLPDNNATVTYDPRRQQFTDRVVNLNSGGASTEQRMSASASFITNGLRLTFIDDPSISICNVFCLFFAGASISVDCGDLTVPHGNGSGTLDFTGIGFEPDLMLFGGVHSGFPLSYSAGSNWGIGAAINDGVGGVDGQYVHSVNRDAASTTNGGGTMSDAVCAMNTLENTAYRGARVTSFDSSGVNMAFVPSSQTSFDYTCAYLAVTLDGTAIAHGVQSIPNATATLSLSTGFEAQGFFATSAGYPQIETLTDYTGNGGYGGNQTRYGAGGMHHHYGNNDGTTTEFYNIADLHEIGRSDVTSLTQRGDPTRFAVWRDDNTDEMKRGATGGFSYSSTAITTTIDQSTGNDGAYIWWFALELEITAHTLTGNSVASGSPVLSTATLVQIVGLGSGNAAAAGSPVLSTGTLGQEHALDGQVLATASPALSTGTLGQIHALDGQVLATGSPALSEGDIGQVHDLAESNLATLTPTLTTGTITQEHAIGAGDAVVAGAPDIHNPSISQTEVLGAGSPVVGGAAILSEGTIGQVHNLAESNLVTPAPVLSTADLDQEHVLDGDDLAIGFVDITIGTLTQEHDLTGDGITTAAPTLTEGTTAQVHALEGVGVTTGSPALTEGTTSITSHLFGLAGGITTQPAAVSVGAGFTEFSALTGEGIVTGEPVVSTGTIAGSVLTGNSITSGTPVVSEAIIGQAHGLAGIAVASGEPILDIGTITQAHVLSGDAVECGALSLSQGELGQVHALDGVPTTTDEPVLGQASLAQTHNLLADAIEATPVLTEGTVAQVEDIGAGDPVIAGAPILSVASLAHIYHLSGEDIVTGEVSVSEALLEQGHTLESNGITGLAWVLSRGTVTEIDNVGAGDEVVAGVPVLTEGTIEETIPLTGEAVVTGEPVVSAADLGQAHKLIKKDIIGRAPVLTIGTLLINHYLGTATITTGAPILGTTKIYQRHALGAGDEAATGDVVLTVGTLGVGKYNLGASSPIVAGTPVLTEAQFGQEQRLTGTSIATPAPIVSIGRLSLTRLLNESRRFKVSREVRTLAVKAEPRTHIVPREVRRYAAKGAIDN